MKRIVIGLLKSLGYFAAIFGVIGLAVFPTKWLLGDPETLGIRMEIFVLGVHLVIGVVVVNLVMTRFSGSRLLRAGWPDIPASWRGFWKGVLLGCGMVLGVMGITWLSGGGRFEFGGARFLDYLAVLPAIAGVLLIAALGEEWIFRGYPLSKLSEIAGRRWANILVSLLFAAGHWGGEGWGSLPAFNLFIFSLVTGAIRFTPGGIPAAWGFHFAWNCLYSFLGATVTGMNLQIPGIRFEGSGPDWLSGGLYGPEGSIGTTITTIVGLVLIGRYLRRRNA